MSQVKTRAARAQPVEATALHAGKVAAYKSRIRALERVLADMLHEFAGYCDDTERGDDDAWREPKVMQRARALLNKGRK